MASTSAACSQTIQTAPSVQSASSTPWIANVTLARNQLYANNCWRSFSVRLHRITSAFYSGPLVAFFTPVLLFVFWVFVRADHLSTTLRARDSALNDFVLIVFCHCSTSC